MGQPRLRPSRDSRPGMGGRGSVEDGPLRMEPVGPSLEIACIPALDASCSGPLSWSTEVQASQGWRWAWVGKRDTCHPSTSALTARSLSSLDFGCDHTGPCYSSLPQSLFSLSLLLNSPSLTQKEHHYTLFLISIKKTPAFTGSPAMSSQLLLLCATYTVPWNFSL